MADKKQLELLRKGVGAWRNWQHSNTHVRADLREAPLARSNLNGVLLSHAELIDADLSGAHFRQAWLVETNLRGANLCGGDFTEAYMHKAILSESLASVTTAISAKFARADLSQADLRGIDLSRADLAAANLSGANLSGANLVGANLRGADLSGAVLVRTDLRDSDLTGCRIHGISAWDLDLKGAIQIDLIITPSEQRAITVDHLEVAQFVYLLLHNEKIREVIETVTSRAVLILGRFTPERKAVLDMLRDELRRHNYVPILFDFEGPEDRDLTETVSTLARLARFIVADLTDPSSIPKELEAIVPTLAIPVQPLIEGTQRSYAMFADYWKYDWVLPPFRYPSPQGLMESLVTQVVAPAEEKVKSLSARRRAMSESE